MNFGTIISTISIVIVAFAVLLSMPLPQLNWSDVILPEAAEYMEAAYGRNGSGNKPLNQEKPLKGLRVAVTGATSGIGLGVTERLVELGATVIAIGRSPSKLQRLQDEVSNEIETVEADFMDLDSVAKAADVILGRYENLDILVNNAGIHNGFEGIIHFSSTKQGYESAFGVNYLSHFLLTEKLIPILKKSPKPKIVQVSSRFHYATDGSDLRTYGGVMSPVASGSGGSHGFFFFRTQRQYASSKLAQILNARSLQERHNITAVAACPTWVGTSIGGQGIQQQILEAVAFPYNGFGISSILHAILDPHSDHDRDFYVNTAMPIPPDNTTPFSYQILPLRDMVLAATSYGILLPFQRLLATRGVDKSSYATYNKVQQDELYEWSQATVSQWL